MSDYPILPNDRFFSATATGGQTVFNADFPLLTAEEVEIKRIRAGVETILVLTTNYTISGLNVEAGFTATLTAGALVDDIMEIRGVTVDERQSDYGFGQALPSAAINADLDRALMRQQEATRDIANALFQATGPAPSTGRRFPAPAASNLIGWTDDGLSLRNYPVPSGAGDVIGPVGAGDGDVAIADGISGKFITFITKAALKTAMVFVKGDVGLGNVDNTSDANKPVSNATQTALDLKAPLASPTFTGTPAAPTAAPGTNTTQVSTTAFVKAAIDVVLGGVAGAFDTLSEIVTELALKAPLLSPALTGNPTAPTPSAGDNDTSIATTAYVQGELAGREPLGEYSAINAQVGTTYTLVLADKGKLVTLNNAGAITLTIPTNAVTAFPVKSRIDLAALGAGQVTVAGAGVTIRSSGGKLKLTGQYSGGTLAKLATDEWLLIGDLTT